MITQTLALFVDAYRELNARKLFWIVLVLSSVIALAMAAMGINEKGLTVLWWEIPIPVFTTTVIARDTFYKMVFIAIGFKLWLTWAATILALVSTAGIMPDFISGGAIELALSKPIGRLRLFLTKYLTGLLFVGLQVSVFSVLAFLVIGLRSGAWLPQIFIAIPLVTLFFSYLFSITTLVGLMTRSTIPSLLATIIIWLLIFLVHLSETGIILQLKIAKEFSVAGRVSQIAATEKDIADLESRGETTSLERRQKDLAWQRDRLADEERQQVTLQRLHAIFFAVKSVLPKTSETMELLSRRLISGTELEQFTQQAQPPGRPSGGTDVDMGDPAVGKEVQRIVNTRPVSWVIGTSLLFEAVLVGASAWIFCRRDF